MGNVGSAQDSGPVWCLPHSQGRWPGLAGGGLGLCPLRAVWQSVGLSSECGPLPVCCCLNCVFPRPSLPKLSPAVTSCQPVVSTLLFCLPRDSSHWSARAQKSFPTGVQSLNTLQSAETHCQTAMETKQKTDRRLDKQKWGLRDGIRERERETGEEQRWMWNRKQGCMHLHTHMRARTHTRTYPERWAADRDKAEKNCFPPIGPV